MKIPRIQISFLGRIHAIFANVWRPNTPNNTAFEAGGMTALTGDLASHGELASGFTIRQGLAVRDLLKWRGRSRNTAGAVG